jgi:hypothetical protein
MAEVLLNPDERENSDELLAELEKVLHAAGNTEADKRIDTMSKEQLTELLQIARTLLMQKQKEKKRKKKGEEQEQEEEQGGVILAEQQQQ